MRSPSQVEESGGDVADTYIFVAIDDADSGTTHQGEWMAQRLLEPEGGQHCSLLIHFIN